MPPFTRSGFAICAITAMTACGGSGTNPFAFEGRAPVGPITSDEAALIAGQYDRLSDEVLGLAASPNGVVPVTGTATFNGKARITVDPGGTAQSMTLTGDAVINADFAAPLLAAQMDNFAGANMAGATVRLDGELRVDGAQIGGTAENAADFTGVFRGRLLGNGIDIDTSGAFAGVLRDNPTAAVSFSGIDDTALYNNAPATVTLTGIAKE